MINSHADYAEDGGEQGDFGLDLFTEQDLVDRLVQAVTDDDLHQVVFWVKTLADKGCISNVNDGQKAAEFLLAATDDEAERWIAHNLAIEDEVQGYQRSHSVPTTGPSGRSSSLPINAKFDHYASSPQYKPVPLRDSSLAQIPEPHLGFIDLTDSRSPSPVPKPEPLDDDEISILEPRSPPTPSSRQVSTKPTRSKGKGRAVDDDERATSPSRVSEEPSHSARAHLRIDNLPIHYTDSDLTNLCSDLNGVVEASSQDTTNDSAWGLITFKSLMAARHAYAVKIGKVAPGGVRGLQLKIYSSEGEPIEPHVAVSPVATRDESEALASQDGSAADANTHASATGANGTAVGQGERYALGFSGGARPEGERGPIYSGQDVAFAAARSNYGNNYGRGGGGPPAGNYSHPGPMPFQGRFFPRPRVPYIFTAAELARRVYLGGLPFGITDDEVGRIFSERAKVKARVLKVKNSPDGSHAFAFVQHPDSITADFAIKSLHGQVYAGHLLQLEHVNELAHRWLFSLTLYGFPSNWEYRDVSDFLISTIGSFAGLRVSRPWHSDANLNVRVELRYETELRWAANELNGLIVRNEPIRAEVDQLGIRKKMEREAAYEKLQDKVLNPDAAQPRQVVGLPHPAANHAAAGGAFSPYNPNYSSTTLATSNGFGASSPLVTGGGSTPLGGRSRPAPPPPPPPAKRSKTTEGSLQPAALAVANEAEPNPFSPRWMMSGK